MQMIGTFDTVAARATEMRTRDGAVSVRETSTAFVVQFHTANRGTLRFHEYEDMRSFLREDGLTAPDVEWTDETARA